jgi:hypothetical protein
MLIGGYQLSAISYQLKLRTTGYLRKIIIRSVNNMLNRIEEASGK